MIWSSKQGAFSFVYFLYCVKHTVDFYSPRDMKAYRYVYLVKENSIRHKKALELKNMSNVYILTNWNSGIVLKSNYVFFRMPSDNTKYWWSAPSLTEKCPFISYNLFWYCFMPSYVFSYWTDFKNRLLSNFHMNKH